jgi:hypothetical protein
METNVNRDIARISDNIVEMARYAETSLRDTVTALLNNDHTLAYGVILRDRYVDDKEKEIDRLCFEFIHKLQPITKALRFAFSAVKINMEIERVGDYAESVARQLLKLEKPPEPECGKGIIELADVAIAMFHPTFNTQISNIPRYFQDYFVLVYHIIYMIYLEHANKFHSRADCEAFSSAIRDVKADIAASRLLDGALFHLRP